MSEWYYPTIVNPETKEYMNIFSEDFNKLLAQGYTESQLLSAKRVVFQNPLTNIKDVDYQILMDLPIYQLRPLCATNQYTRQLCQNRQFWLQKINRDGLDVAFPTNFNDYKIDNWIKVYDILDTIDAWLIEDTDGRTEITAMINHTEINYYVKLFLKYGVINDTTGYDNYDIKSMGIIADYINNENMIVIYPLQEEGVDTFHIDMNNEQMINIVFEAMMDKEILEFDDGL